MKHKLLILSMAAALLCPMVVSAEDPPADAPSDPTLIGDQARAVKETVKHDAKVVGDAAKEGAHQVATKAKAVAHEVASASKEGAQQVAASAKKGAKAVKATVKGDKGASDQDTTKPKEAPREPKQ